MKNGTYDPDKLRKNLAIKASIEFGKEIRDKIPDIENDYRNGKSLSDIVRERHICDVLGISVDMAMTSVHYALRGHDGGYFQCFNLPAYNGLIPREELEVLARNHGVDYGEKMGKLNGSKNYKQGKGISSLSKEKLREHGAKGGRVKTRKGFGVLNEEQLRDRTIYLAGIMGYIPYSREEDETILRLSEEQKYTHQQGRSIGRTNLDKLTKEINESFHDNKEVRSAEQIKFKLYRLRKKKNKSK